MNKDKITGYVQAMIDNYFNKFERAEAPYVKNHLGTVLEDLGNLRNFMDIEEEPINIAMELDSKELAQSTLKDLENFKSEIDIFKRFVP